MEAIEDRFERLLPGVQSDAIIGHGDPLSFKPYGDRFGVYTIGRVPKILLFTVSREFVKQQDPYRRPNGEFTAIPVEYEVDGRRRVEWVSISGIE